MFKCIEKYSTIIENKYRKYYLFIVDTDENFSVFDELMEKKKIKEDNKVIIGIDIEFNSKDIALMQINFEFTEETDKGYIILFNPNFIKEKTLNNLMNKYMLNRHIKKIVQGGDTQDMKHLLEGNFLKNNKMIKRYLRTLIDTRYLCEYLMIKNSTTSKLCGIYEIMFNSGIITEDEYNALQANIQTFVTISNVLIDVRKLRNQSNILLYCYTDVIHLVRIYEYFKNKLGYFFDNIIELTRLINYDRFGVINIYNQYIETINGANINFVLYNNKNLLLNKLYEDIINYYLSFNQDFNYLYRINNFNKFNKLFLKIVIYNGCKRYFKTIYRKKGLISDDNFEIMKKKLFCKSKKMPGIYKIFDDLDTLIKNNIKMVLKI